MKISIVFLTLLSTIDAKGTLINGKQCVIDSTDIKTQCGTTGSCCMQMLLSVGGTSVSASEGICVGAGTAKGSSVAPPAGSGLFTSQTSYYTSADCNTYPDSYGKVFTDPSWAEIMASIWVFFWSGLTLDREKSYNHN